MCAWIPNMTSSYCLIVMYALTLPLDEIHIHVYEAKKDKKLDLNFQGHSISNICITVHWTPNGTSW